MKTAALTAAYATYKRAKRVSAPLTGQAEFMHDLGGDVDWNESYYFNFTDTASGIGGYTRIGVLPNRDSDIGVMMLYAGGTRLLATYQSGRVVADQGGLVLGELSYLRVEPLWNWKLAFSGEMADLPDSRMLRGSEPGTFGRVHVEVDLQFKGLAPCFNFKDADPRALAEMLTSAGTRLSDMRKVSRVSSEHYEQAGACTGRVRVGDTEFRIEGSGHRDHSWGVRDWSAPSLWTWLTCQFPGELAFNLSRVVIGSVDVFNGFISRGGRNYPLRRAKLETEFEADGVTQKELRLGMEDTGGKTIEVTGRVLTVIPLDLSSRGHSTLVNEALAEYAWEDKKALGIAEYLHQIRP